jgi:hypothetical protein
MKLPPCKAAWNDVVRVRKTTSGAGQCIFEKIISGIGR